MDRQLPFEAQDPASQIVKEFSVAADKAEMSFQDAEAASGEEAPLTLEAEQQRAIILGLRANSLLLQNLILTLEVIQEDRAPEVQASAERIIEEQSGQGEQQARVDRNLLHLPVRNKQAFYTSTQAANYLGISLATIRRWNDTGHIEALRTPGGQRRFTQETLDRFLGQMAAADPRSNTA